MYSTSSYSKAVFLSSAVFPHYGKNTMEVNGYHPLFGYQMFSFVSNSYRFGTTWGVSKWWQIFNIGWIIPLTAPQIHFTKYVGLASVLWSDSSDLNSHLWNGLFKSELAGVGVIRNTRNKDKLLTCQNRIHKLKRKQRSNIASTCRCQIGCQFSRFWCQLWVWEMFLHVHTQLQLSPYREHLLCSLLVFPGPRVTLHLETLPAHPHLTWSLLTYTHKYANTHIQRFIGYRKDLKHKTLPAAAKICKSHPLLTNSTKTSVLLCVITLQKDTIIIFFS